MKDVYSRLRVLVVNEQQQAFYGLDRLIGIEGLGREFPFVELSYVDLIDDAIIAVHEACDAGAPFAVIIFDCLASDLKSCSEIMRSLRAIDRLVQFIVCCFGELLDAASDLFNDYFEMQKPFNNEALVRMLQMACRRWLKENLFVQRQKELEDLVHHRTIALREARSELQLSLEQSRAMAQKAQESCEAKTQFFDQMSHDIRTPMGGIVGMAEVLASSQLSEEQLECVEIISESAEMLMSMLNDLLDISRIDSGRLAVENIPFNLLDTVELSGQLIAPKAEEKRVELFVHCSPDLPEMVCGDPTRLRQVLNNLLNNAVKFTNEGYVLVEASFVQVEDKQSLRFAVSDTGEGIDERKLDLIFERFVQENGTVARAHGGSGLGLCICKELVELMGGKISVSSEKGEGSIFEVIIPYQPEEQVDETSHLLLSRRELSLLNLLVITRHPLESQFLKELLDSWGCSVFIANNLDEASVLIDAQKRAFDLMFVSEQKVKNYSKQFIEKICGSLSNCVALRPIGQMHEHSDSVNALRYLTTIHTPYRRSALQKVFQRVGMRRLVADQNRLAVMGCGELYKPIHICERVLVVESSQASLMVIKRFLQELGFIHIDLLGCKQDALERYERGQSYDLIFIAVQLDDADGCDLAMELRRSPSWRDVPMVALSTVDNSQDRFRCSDAGMNEYLAKPFRRNQFVHACQRSLPWVSFGLNAEVSMESEPDPTSLLKRLKDSSTQV